MHKGKLVVAWLAKNPRFKFSFTPVHCSWMNHFEQWFSILQRKRLEVSDFEDLKDLEGKLLTFINEWNQEAAPFEWTRKSFEKTLTKVDAALKAAA